MYFNKDFRVININNKHFLAINTKSIVRSDKVYKLRPKLVEHIVNIKINDVNFSDDILKLFEKSILTNEYCDNSNVNFSPQKISSISFEIEGKCNLNCLHCYQSEKISSSLSKNQIFEIIDKISDAGCVFLQLTGGEPMLRKDFLDIYKYASRKGLLLKISSNGTLLNPTIVEEFKNNPPYLLSISFYGVGKEADNTTRTKNYFEYFAENIKSLQNEGIKIDLKLIILKSNQRKYFQMINFAEKYSTTYHIYTKLIKCLNSDSTSEFIADRKYIELAAENNNQKINRIEKSTKKKICNAGSKSFVIDSEGNMSICKLCRGHRINILEKNLFQVNKFFSKILPIVFEKPHKCKTCKDLDCCTTCPVVLKSFLNNTDNCFCV